MISVKLNLIKFLQVINFHKIYKKNWQNVMIEKPLNKQKNVKYLVELNKFKMLIIFNLTINVYNLNYIKMIINKIIKIEYNH